MESDGHAMARRKFHENLLEVLPICRFPMPNTKKKKKVSHEEDAALDRRFILFKYSE